MSIAYRGEFARSAPRTWLHLCEDEGQQEEIMFSIWRNKSEQRMEACVVWFLLFLIDVIKEAYHAE
jgi:hypothetical protein